MLPDKLNQYVSEYSKGLSIFLTKIKEQTDGSEGAHMICGSTVAALLSILTKLTNAKLALDIGTYVGFSACAIAEAMNHEGRVISCEQDPRCFEIAQKNFSEHPHGYKVKQYFGDAKNCIAELNEPIDIAFLDAHKKFYLDYYELVVEKMRSGGVIVVDDALWKGEVVVPTHPRHDVMHQFNERIHNDPRVENILIPIRNGVNLIYKL